MIFSKHMPEFNATLLREKFILRDTMPSDFSDSEPKVALSNRLVLTLQSGQVSEKIIIRAQNMHNCTRLGAYITHDVMEKGPLLNRKAPFDWNNACHSIAKDYEKKWNPNFWFSVYHKGRLLYEQGEHHLFLDIIEQCDARNKENYEKSLEMAEDAFKQAGKLVTIKYDSNIALTLHITEKQARCGVILRGPSKTATFNFTADSKTNTDLKTSPFLSATATFLEGIQLSFLIGMTNKKLYYELISPSSEEASRSKAAATRLARLRQAIDQFETLYDVSYRPERPDFSSIIDDAEIFAQKMLDTDIQAKIKHDDNGEWVV